MRKGINALKKKRPLNRTIKFLYNTFFAIICQLVVLITGFITPRFMLKYYGSEINGLITSITQFISYFNLVEAGLSSASVYALYKPLAENNHEKISSIVVATQRFYIISGYIFLGMLIILALLYPISIKVEGLGYWQVLFLVLILGFAGVLEFFTLGKYRALLTADQKLYVISFSSILYTILNTTILVIMAVLQINIIMVKAVALSSIILRCIILHNYSRRNYPYINYRALPDNKALNKRWDALYLQILGSIQNGAPVILATLFLNLKAVSVYSIYNMIVGGIAAILGVFTNGLSSSFGDIIARNQLSILQKAYQEFEFVYYCLITIVYSVSFVMIMPFVQLYTIDITDANYYNPVLGILFVLNALFYNLKTPQGMLIISAGHYRETRMQVTIQVGLVIAVGVILVPKLGLVGILLGLICSNLYRDIDLIFYIPKNITKLSVFTSIKRIIGVVVELMIIILPFCYFKINCSTYIQWIQHATVVTIYATVVTLILGGISNWNEMTGIWNRIKEIRKKTYGII